MKQIYINPLDHEKHADTETDLTGFWIDLPLFPHVFLVFSSIRPSLVVCFSVSLQLIPLFLLALNQLFVFNIIS